MSGRVLVSIGMAAQLLGVHPQTLRQYERLGLVSPARTSGGARRYREQDMVRLKRIQELTELGMSLAAVKHVLGLEQEVAVLRKRLEQLEKGSSDRAGDPGARVVRSTSLEIVHVPRRRRTPRWSNEYW